MKKKITIEEFIQEVWEVEHVKLRVNFKDDLTHLVDHYPYTIPISGECTDDEFMEQRINPILINALSPNMVITCQL